MQHKHKLFLIHFFLLFLTFSVSAQQKKILHNTYDLDSIKTIQINIHDKPEIVFWSGNYLMTETKVELYLATQGIFKFYIEKKGRYDFVPTVNGASFVLKSKDTTRKKIRTKRGECPEVVKVRIFIPDTYKASGNNTWISTIEEDTETQFGTFTSDLKTTSPPAPDSTQEKKDSIPTPTPVIPIDSSSIIPATDTIIQNDTTSKS